MKVLIDTYRTTTPEEMAQFNLKLFQIINGVAERVEHSQYHYWYVEVKDRTDVLQASVAVDIAVGNYRVPHLVRALHDNHYSHSTASAQASVSTQYSDEVIQEVINQIVESLEKHLEASCSQTK